LGVRNEIMEKICLNCKRKFKTYPKHPKHFCSRKCFIDYHKVKKVCPVCNKSFEPLEHGNERIFCSRKCFSLFPKKESTKEKIRNSNLGENNGMWKGNNVGYGALHDWIKVRKFKPELCENCKKNKPYDLANISGEYRRDINDFEWLCRKCHMKVDGRIINLNNKTTIILKRDKLGKFVKVKNVRK
jgi:hypothetical protein